MKRLAALLCACVFSQSLWANEVPISTRKGDGIMRDLTRSVMNTAHHNVDKLSLSLLMAAQLNDAKLLDDAEMLFLGVLGINKETNSGEDVLIALREGQKDVSQANYYLGRYLWAMHLAGYQARADQVARWMEVLFKSEVSNKYDFWARMYWFASTSHQVHPQILFTWLDKLSSAGMSETDITWSELLIVQAIDDEASYGAVLSMMKERTKGRSVGRALASIDAAAYPVWAATMLASFAKQYGDRSTYRQAIRAKGLALKRTVNAEDVVLSKLVTQRMPAWPKSELQ